MKLYCAFLQIVFFCTILFVGSDSYILAQVIDVDVDYDGPYEAYASAERYGGVPANGLNGLHINQPNGLHVKLFASVYSSPNGRNSEWKIRMKVPAKGTNLKYKSDVPTDGTIYKRIRIYYAFEPNICVAASSIYGYDKKSESGSQVNNPPFYNAVAAAAVPEMIEPDSIVNTPGPDTSTDDDPEPGIYPIDPSDTPSPGERHGYKLITAAPYYYVSWYVKTPWDTSELGEYIEGDNGDGSSTEATMYYTYPSGAMHTGNFTITAVISRWSDMSQYEETYVATVVLE